jgi:hypothetical protein
VTNPRCDQITLADLTDYAAGESSGAAAVAIEEHLFSCTACAARAAELDALVRAIPGAARSADIGGFVTDDLLNRLARDGVRVRTFVLAPGAIVPCAVWDDDELMVLRMRADFGGASEVTMSQRVAGNEVLRSTAPVPLRSPGELIYTLSAAWVRQLPVVDVEVLLTTHEQEEERTVGSYTLVHGGSLHR